MDQLDRVADANQGCVVLKDLLKNCAISCLVIVQYCFTGWK